MKAVKTYNPEKITVATLASHTALQLLRAAKHEGFRTLAIASDSTAGFYKRLSFVDTVFTASPNEIERLAPELVERNTVFIPHGSFVEYCDPERAQEFGVPFFGTRSLIGLEADQHQKMQLLRESGLPAPKQYQSAEDAEQPVIVKFHGAKGGKGYFIAKDKKTLQEKLSKTSQPYIIQEYLIGVPAYIHFFASPMYDRVELFGADVRYESNVDGRVLGFAEPSFTVVGNRPLVLRESLLPKLAQYGEAFASAVEKKTGQKMIGPFCLETIIDDNMEVKVFEFSGRIVAGTNVYMGVGSSYSTLYFDQPIDMGERIALEIREAVKKGLLELVTT